MKLQSNFLHSTPKKRNSLAQYNWKNGDYILVNQVLAPTILALTFTKETASNMREKVEKLLQGKEVIVKAR